MSIGDDISQIVDSLQQEAEGVHNEGVMSDSQKLELACGSLKEGLSVSYQCPSQAQHESLLNEIATNQKEESVENITEKSCLI